MAPSKGPRKFRWWCLTIYNLELDFEPILRDKVRYIAYGLETAPSTGRKHLQTFVYFNNPQSSAKNVGRLFGNAHAEPMAGSAYDNEDYCSKEGELVELGEKPSQGARSDLSEIRDEISNGLSVDELTLERPHLFHQYGRTLCKLEDILLRKRFRTEMTAGFWYWGPTGCGKSHTVFSDFSPETHYVKCLDDDWWDGYCGQRVVVLNEFRGELALGRMLELVDKWPVSVKRRNREPVPFLSKEVRVTCPCHPTKIYFSDGDDKISQLLRRFSVIKLEQKCSKGNTGSFEPCISLEFP